MTAWSDLPGGYDLSHWDGPIDWGLLASTDPFAVVLKVSQNMTVDPMFDAYRKEAEQRKIPWLWYPWLLSSDTDTVIKHALGVVGDKKVPAALDWEMAGVRNTVMARWMDLCEADGRPGLRYHGMEAPDAVTPRIAKWLWWFPEYPGSPTAPPRKPMWSGHLPVPPAEWFIWQWSEKGRVPGVKTLVDMDRLSCPRADFKAWYDTGVLPAHVAAPPPGLDGIARVLRLNMTGDDVALLQHALAAKGYYVAISGHYLSSTFQAVLNFQRSQGLKPINGIAGPTTLRALAAG
jgi:GH25 family lysozyme M1 (1,4-beta-N-acetylmuramidase)